MQFSKSFKYFIIELAQGDLHLFCLASLSGSGFFCFFPLNNNVSNLLANLRARSLVVSNLHSENKVPVPNPAASYVER